MVILNTTMVLSFFIFLLQTYPKKCSLQSFLVTPKNYVLSTDCSLKNLWVNNIN